MTAQPMISVSNLIDAATLTGGGAVTTLPVANLADAQPRKVYRTIGTSAYFIADFGSAVAFDVAAIIGAPLTAAATYRFRASTADATVTSSLLLDSGVLSGIHDTAYNSAVFYPSSTVTARYFRVDVADASLSYIDLGRAWVGPGIKPGLGIAWGANIGFGDTGLKARSPGGQQMVKHGGKYRIWNLTLANLSEAESTSLFEGDRVNGITRDVLISRDINDSSTATNWMIGLPQQVSAVSFEAFGIYRKGYQVEERI